MGKKADDTTTENISTLKAISDFVFLELYDQPFMQERENGSDTYTRAIALQCDTLLIFHSTLRELREGDVYSKVTASTALRSMIEIIANLHYFACKVGDKEIGDRYLKSAEKSVEALLAFRKKHQVDNYYGWCDISISKRVNNFDKDYGSDYSYSSLYRHLSSFVHGDAFLLQEHTITKEQVFRLYYAIEAGLMLHLDKILVKAGVIDKSIYLVAVIKSQIALEKKEKKPSESIIKKYNEILQTMLDND